MNWKLLIRTYEAWCCCPVSIIEDNGPSGDHAWVVLHTDGGDFRVPWSYPDFRWLYDGKPSMLAPPALLFYGSQIRLPMEPEQQPSGSGARGVPGGASGTAHEARALPADRNVRAPEPGPWRLVDELGETVLTGSSPDAVIQAIAERCRVRGTQGAARETALPNVPQIWKLIVSWGWRMILVTQEYQMEVKLKVLTNGWEKPIVPQEEG